MAYCFLTQSILNNGFLVRISILAAIKAFSIITSVVKKSSSACAVVKLSKNQLYSCQFAASRVLAWIILQA